MIANDSGFHQLFVRVDDVFVTTAPNGVGFANTMFDWGGRSWAIILLPLPTDALNRVTLLMHEVFHREQKALGLAGQDPPKAASSSRASSISRTSRCVIVNGMVRGLLSVSVDVGELVLARRKLAELAAARASAD